MVNVLQRARAGSIERLCLNRSEGDNTLCDSLHDAPTETSRESNGDTADRSRAPW